MLKETNCKLVYCNGLKGQLAIFLCMKFSDYYICEGFRILWWIREHLRVKLIGGTKYGYSGSKKDMFAIMRMGLSVRLFNLYSESTDARVMNHYLNQWSSYKYHPSKLNYGLQKLGVAVVDMIQLSDVSPTYKVLG